VRVVPATLAPSLGVGARGIKTDRRDAQVLSEVSCRVELRLVHIPSEQARAWRTLCNSRDALVTSRTKLRARYAAQKTRCREQAEQELAQLRAQLERLKQ